MDALHRVFDANKDGLLDARDPAFGKFGIWVDANADGVSDPGEVKSLAQHGIARIGLNIANPLARSDFPKSCLLATQNTYELFMLGV